MLLMSCLILGKLFNFTEPSFSQLKVEIVILTCDNSKTKYLAQEGLPLGFGQWELWQEIREGRVMSLN